MIANYGSIGDDENDVCAFYNLHQIDSSSVARVVWDGRVERTSFMQCAENENMVWRVSSDLTFNAIYLSCWILSNRFVPRFVRYSSIEYEYSYTVYNVIHNNGNET